MKPVSTRRDCSKVDFWHQQCALGPHERGALCPRTPTFPNWQQIVWLLVDRFVSQSGVSSFTLYVHQVRYQDNTVFGPFQSNSSEEARCTMCVLRKHTRSSRENKPMHFFCFVSCCRFFSVCKNLSGCVCGGKIPPPTQEGLGLLSLWFSDTLVTVTLNQYLLLPAPMLVVAWDMRERHLRECIPL